MDRFLAFPDVAPLCGVSPANLRALFDRFGPSAPDGRRLIAENTGDVLGNGRGRVALLELFTVRQLVLAAELTRCGLSWEHALERGMVFVGMGGNADWRIAADGAIGQAPARDCGELFGDGLTALVVNERGATVYNLAPGVMVNPLALGSTFRFILIDPLWRKIDAAFATRGIA